MEPIIESPARKAGISALVIATTLALGLSACTAAPAEEGPSSDAALSIEIEGVGTVAEDPELAALVPEQFVESGLLIAATAPHPPFLDFREVGVPGDFVGVDYDLMQAIATRLGITATFEPTPFDGIIPGLQAEKFNVLTGLADLKERQQTVTFVDYSKTGAAIVVRTGTSSIKVLADLCGKKVAVLKGSTLLKIVVAADEKCESGSIEAIEYPDEAATIQAVISGAADALITAKVNALVLQDNVDDLTAISDPAEPNGYAANPNGIGVLNQNADLATAIQAALQSLIDDGTYTAIYEKWGLGDIQVASAEINGAIN